jgi:hypothetical protein
VRSDRRLTCRMTAGGLDMSKETVVQDLGMRKLAAKLVPRNLTTQQKDRRLTSCMDFKEQLQQDNFLGVITGDESWYYQYDPGASASPWSGDRRIPPGLRGHGCQSLQSKQC